MSHPSQPQPKVTRWAAIVHDELVARDLDPDYYGPVILGHIYVESGGDPSSYHEGSSGFGLGGLLQWVDGQSGAYRGGPKRNEPYLHPKATSMGRPLTWDPRHQIGAMVSVYAHHLERSKYHLPSASQAYNSGGANLAALAQGNANTGTLRQAQAYPPKLWGEAVPQYRRWWSAWQAAGYPRLNGGEPLSLEVGRGGEGGTYRLVLAAFDVGELGPDPGPDPRDGWALYGGFEGQPEIWAQWRKSGELPLKGPSKDRADVQRPTLAPLVEALGWTQARIALAGAALVIGATAAVHHWQQEVQR